MSAIAVAIGGAIVAGVAMDQAEDAADAQIEAQREANAAQQRAASVSAQQERIKAVREARIRSAQITASGGAAGVGQASSGIAGSISSIGSQTGANIGSINVQEGFAAQASAANQRAAAAGNKMAEWQGIQQLGMQAVSFGVGKMGAAGKASTPGGASGPIKVG